MANCILMVTCKDQKGILANVTNFIYHHNGNIINLEQHTDTKSKLFFMRLEWSLTKFRIQKSEIKYRLNSLFQDVGIQVFENKLWFSEDKLRLAIFVSKYQHCLYDLLLRNQSGELDCKIPLIVSNHSDASNAAKHFGVKFVEIPISADTKVDAEQKQLELLAKNEIDFIVLARYMQILSGKFVNYYPSRIINIHHSFLPAFAGAKPYTQAYSKGVKIIGATSHFVTDQLDEGPIIEQDTLKISHRDTVSDLVTKGRNVERQVLAEAVRLYIDHRIFVHGRRTIIL